MIAAPSAHQCTKGDFSGACCTKTTHPHNNHAARKVTLGGADTSYAAMVWMVNLERTIRCALDEQTNDLHTEEDARLGPEPGGVF